ncbi:MAG: ribosome assembly RNA-binding protein YhbY [Spirochaetes bacterium]|nr:MAG: ribosome assembly RNA-binding protein YhbY [Spirochaetota bacterium]
MELTKTQRRWLGSKAQKIKPTVMIGKEGLSEGVTAQTDAELEAHELIKVRFVGHKEYIKEIAPLLAEGTKAVLVRTIGHVAVLYRPREDEDKRDIVLPRK